MVHLHAVRKLLNIGRIKSELLVTSKTEGQLMHDWYVTSTGTLWPGKTVVMYFHEPSLMMVAVPGRTVDTTFPRFRARLRALLERKGFPSDFIERETALAETHVTGKTSNRSMLASINQALFAFECHLGEYESFEETDFDRLEDLQMENLHSKGKRDYETPLEHWELALGCRLLNIDRR